MTKQMPWKLKNGNVLNCLSTTNALANHRLGKLDQRTIQHKYYPVRQQNGDEFKGAPGSTLLIDDLEIEYK